MNGTKGYWSHVARNGVKIPIYADFMTNPTSYRRNYLGTYFFDDGVYLLNCLGCKNIRLLNIPKIQYWGYYGDSPYKTILVGEFLIPQENHQNYHEVLYSLKHKYYYDEKN